MDLKKKLIEFPQVLYNMKMFANNVSLGSYRNAVHLQLGVFMELTMSTKLSEMHYPQGFPHMYACISSKLPTLLGLHKVTLRFAGYQDV